MALKGLKVIELVGLAPGPFCGQVLSDFGAEVLRIDRPFDRNTENLQRGADVVLEPFRAGVMERLGLGPDVLMKINDKLIYARLTGYGQSGHLSQKAGHDINFLAISGILSRLGTPERPIAPLNILGDYAGGGLMCALGILLALYERHKSGKGEVIDCNLTEGIAYISSWIWDSFDHNFSYKDIIWPKPDQRMSNLYDGGSPFYRCYKTKDNKFMAVGAMEFQFYSQLTQVLGINPYDYDREDTTQWPRMSSEFEKIFATKTQEEWMSLFDKVDACVTPVLDFDCVHKYKHNCDRNSFFSDGKPRPAPKFLRIGSIVESKSCDALSDGKSHTKQVLLQLGYNEIQINSFAKQKIVEIEDFQLSKL